MCRRQQLQILLRYDLWSTRKLLDHITRYSPFREEVACLAFLAHIVNMQEIWYDRVVENSFSKTEKWDEYKPKVLRKKAHQLSRKWIDLIGDHDVTLQTEIRYFTGKRLKKMFVSMKFAGILSFTENFIGHKFHFFSEFVILSR